MGFLLLMVLVFALVVVPFRLGGSRRPLAGVLVPALFAVLAVIDKATERPGNDMPGLGAHLLLVAAGISLIPWAIGVARRGSQSRSEIARQLAEDERRPIPPG
jgi:hypothetical protein